MLFATTQSPPGLHSLFDAMLQPLGATATTLQDALLHLLLAFVLSLPLAVVYVRTHHGMSYSRGYVQSLVLLSLVVTAVMMAVGDSLARAFGFRFIPFGGLPFAFFHIAGFLLLVCFRLPHQIKCSF